MRIHPVVRSPLARVARITRTLVVIVAATACSRVANAPVAAPTPAVGFVLVNDVYVADTLRDGSGGVARLPAVQRELGEERVLTVLAGDVLSPSLLSKWYAGKQMVDAFNAARLDYATFGNHEFELDRDTLLTRIRASRFRWISSNCTDASGARFPGVPSWDTTTVNGVRVGLFGLTLPGDYRKYVRCADPDSAAHAAVAELRAVGAQLIVGLTHQNLATDSALLAREPDIALILGGHEHEWHRVAVGERLVVKADANARTAQVVRVRRVANAWRPDARLDTLDRRVPLDRAAEAVIHAWQDSLVRRLGPERVVGTAPSPIEARDAIQRRAETGLGDLVTDAMRAGTRADVALINSGTMRIDDVIRAGPITNYQLESIFLFADETHVLTFPIAGARLRELLEHSVASAGHGGFAQVSGLSFTWDSTRAAGSRIVGPLRRDDGRAIAPGDTLTLAMNWYPACEHGDAYVVPEAAGACPGASRAPRVVDLLMAHLEHDLRGNIVAPTPGRIVRR